MKRKYYLRGLGIGILVTAFILGITANKSKAMTDEEVMARARELGMVEDTVLSNIGSNHSDTESTEPQPPETTPEEAPDQTIPDTQPAEADEPEDSSDQTMPDIQPAEADEPGDGPDQTVPETQPADADDSEDDSAQTIPETDVQTVTLTISRGESSASVSRMLAEAGLVENASAYDRYLCSNGYDKKIRTGIYEIPVGASEEEIARIISGGN